MEDVMETRTLMMATHAGRGKDRSSRSLVRLTASNNGVDANATQHAYLYPIPRRPQQLLNLV